MGDRRKTIEYNRFSGGLCSIDNGRECLKNQLQAATNLVVDDDGSLRKRPGALRESSTNYADFIIDLAEDGSNISLHNKTLYIGPSLAHTYTTGGLGQFLKTDYVCHTNGRDAAVMCSSLPATAVLGSPLSRIIFKHNDRAFMAADNVLYETEVDTYPSDLVDNFAGGATWTVGDSNSDIVGLGSIGRNLYIFKSDSIFVQYGYTKNERQTYNLTTEYGCVSPDSIKNVNLAGVGDCIIFLSDSKKLCAVTESGVIELGDAVQDILDTIYEGAAVNEKSLATLMHRARAGVHPNGYYILGFATTSGDTHNAFNKALCMNLKAPYSSQFGTRWPFTLWEDIGGGTTSGQTFGAFADSKLNASALGSGVLIPTTTADDGYYTFSRLTFDYYYDRQNISFPYDEDYWILYKLKTRNEDAGTKRFNKQWVEMRVRLQQMKPDVGLAFFPIKVTQEVDYDLTIDSPPEIYQENLVLGNKPVKYILEGFHGLVSDGVQTNITLENYIAATTIDLRIYGIDILFLRSNAV